MDYMTLKEASEQWGVTPRWINYYCTSGRIPGAVKMATIWLIPKDARNLLMAGQNVERDNTMSKILLLEDDISLVDGLKYSLKKNGFEVEIVRTVAEAVNSTEDIGKYDLLILDVTLPDGTGFDVCEAVRRRGQQVPIIFLTAADEEVNIIRGLDSGGDDYITKPFSIGELCSRIRALLRRAGVVGQTETTSIECGDITIDLLGSRALLNGKKLELTSAEYRLLCLLVRNVNRTVTRDIILSELWDEAGNFVDNNTLSVYVRRLREKVEADPSHPQHLITVRGFGYQWKEAAI